MEDNKFVLEVSDLHTTFKTDNGDVSAVNGVSFKLEPGKTLGIVGESGSGKSVTAYSIMQILAENGAITGGSVKYKGEDITKWNKKKMADFRGKCCSIIFQDPMTSLNPVFTVGYQLEEAVLLHTDRTKKEAKERAIEMLTLVGVNEPEKRVNQYPHELSGGMRQRVMIAMALACEPDILIADEPTTALDVTIQSQILKLLKKINERHHTAILFISHDLGVIRSLCDRVIVMNAGHILQIGKPQEVFDRPASPFIADFMGFSTFLHGIAAGTEGDMRLIRCGAHTLQVPAEAAQELTEGDACILAIRSENIRTAEQEGVNTVRGTVKSATYKGHTTRLEVSGCFEEMVYPAIHEYADVQEGSEVLLHFPAQHFCVYKDIK